MKRGIAVVAMVVFLAGGSGAARAAEPSRKRKVSRNSA
jgi:hypothetical protein